MQINKAKALFFLITTLIILVLVFVFLIFRDDLPETVSNPPLPTPVDLPKQNTKAQGQEPPFPSPNPTYIELLKTQPFWDLLPYRTNSYLVEHIMQSNTIRITTLGPIGENRRGLIESYREQALDWLRENGANLNELQIEYVPEI